VLGSKLSESFRQTRSRRRLKARYSRSLSSLSCSGSPSHALRLRHGSYFLFGRVPAWHFARANAPAQSVALGTQSSLASLPAMIEAAEIWLGLSPKVVGVVLPLAVSVFRYSTSIWLIVASFFVARLYNIALSPTQIATVCLISVLMSIGGVGLPSGASYFAPITPVFLSVGLPLEAIPILFAVDTIPDMVETASNVTADMTATTIVNQADVSGSRSVTDGN
jgi:proton glutamate symport protein